MNNQYCKIISIQYNTKKIFKLFNKNRKVLLLVFFYTIVLKDYSYLRSMIFSNFFNYYWCTHTFLIHFTYVCVFNCGNGLVCFCVHVYVRWPATGLLAWPIRIVSLALVIFTTSEAKKLRSRNFDLSRNTHKKENYINKQVRPIKSCLKSDSKKKTIR